MRVCYKRELFIIEAQFFDEKNKLLKGDQLFVQCFLIGPNGQLHKLNSKKVKSRLIRINRELQHAKFEKKIIFF